MANEARRTIARIIGVLAGLQGIALLFLWCANRPTARLGGHDLSSLIFMAPASLLAGLGMLWLRKWGALLIAIPLAALLLALARELLFRGLPLAVGVANLAIWGGPLAVVLWTWPGLKWRARAG